jgi:outer membrane protein assembly factor BamB
MTLPGSGTGRNWAAVTLIVLGSSLPLGAQNWPMWGGTAARNMSATVTGLPESWDAAKKTNIKWKAELGSSSYGNPVVADGKVFVGTNNANPRNAEVQGDKGVLMCFREADGEFLWQAVSDKLASGMQNDWPEQGVCSSPAVEGKRVYYVTNRAELVCLDTEGFRDGTNDGLTDEPRKGPTDADVIWKLDMMKDLGVFQHNMANSSPVVWEDLVFVETSNGRDEDHEKIPSPKAPSFIAVNKNTGKVVWQDASPGPDILHGQWSSPTLAEVNGTMQAIFPGGNGWLYGFNARTGDPLWKFDLNPKDAVWPKTRNDGIATPVFAEGKVFMAVGQDPESGEGVGHFYAIDPSKRGDITESGRVWHYGAIRRSISTAAVVNDIVFLSDFSGFLHAVDAQTGKGLWTFDVLAAVWGSPLVADGKVYLGDEDGDVVVLQAGREMKKLAEMNMGNSVYSSPIAANGTLYVMTTSALYAIATPRSGSGK